MPKCVAHQRSARRFLLTAAACLALAMVWAMVAAEVRDGDAGSATPAAASQAPAAGEQRAVEAPGAAGAGAAER